MAGVADDPIDIEFEVNTSAMRAWYTSWKGVLIDGADGRAETAELLQSIGVPSSEHASILESLTKDDLMDLQELASNKFLEHVAATMEGQLPGLLLLDLATTGGFLRCAQVAFNCSLHSYTKALEKSNKRYQPCTEDWNRWILRTRRPHGRNML